MVNGIEKKDNIKIAPMNASKKIRIISNIVSNFQLILKLLFIFNIPQLF